MAAAGKALCVRGECSDLIDGVDAESYLDHGDHHQPQSFYRSTYHRLACSQLQAHLKRMSEKVSSLGGGTPTSESASLSFSELVCAAF